MRRPLILAIEPDRRQAAKITTLARTQLEVDIVIADSTELALQAITRRVPDLILTSLLLSRKDEALLTDRLRELDAAGTRVPTLVVPVLGAPRRSQKGLLTRLRGARGGDASTDGCDPAVFGEQIAEYLERAAAERRAAAVALEDQRAAMEDSVYDTRREAERARPERGLPSGDRRANGQQSPRRSRRRPRRRRGQCHGVKKRFRRSISKSCGRFQWKRRASNRSSLQWKPPKFGWRPRSSHKRPRTPGLG